MLLIFVVAFVLAGFDIKKVPGLFLGLITAGTGFVFSLVIGGAVLAAASLLLVFVILMVWKAGFRNTDAVQPKRKLDGLPVVVRPSDDGQFVERSVRERLTHQLLYELEWRRFEILVEAVFRAEGKNVFRMRAGADGGIDLALRDTVKGPITGIVQCKAWRTYSVGVKPVRELFGVMHSEGAARGYFVTSGRYSGEAIEFAKYKPLELIDGNGLLGRFNSLEEGKQNEILSLITEGDYATPTCPSCETKMRRRTSKYGEFWGCKSYPRCRQTFRIGT